MPEKRVDQPSVEDLLARIQETGYEPPVIDQMNPELRSVKYTAPTAYGLSSFNIHKAVQAFAEGKLLDVAKRVTQPDKNPELLAENKNFEKDEAASVRAIGVIVSWKANPSWYDLNETERKAYWAHVYGAMDLCEAEGAKILGKYACRLNCDDEYFVVWEHPSIETAENMIMRLDSLDFQRYFTVTYKTGRAQPRIRTVQLP